MVSSTDTKRIEGVFLDEEEDMVTCFMILLFAAASGGSDIWNNCGLLWLVQRLS